MSGAPLWEVLTIGLLTGGATLLGGTLVLRFNSALDLLLGFSSGTIIGVALFDLLPEALDLAGDNQNGLGITTALAIGFALYLLVDRLSIFLSQTAGRPTQFAPASLTAHSFLDGLGIGLAFHLSAAAGVVVAIGVLGHDLIDGANTVALSLSSGARSAIARAWLVADAIAPLAGILVASTIAIPVFPLATLLGVFAGFFLYIGASQLLPLSHARRPSLSTTGATLFGLAFIYAVLWLARDRL